VTTTRRLSDLTYADKSGAEAGPIPIGGSRLGRAFYATDAATLARRLLGQRVVRVLGDGTRLSGLIVETEAYLGVRDRASHAFGRRRTTRNESMYARPGTAYVYFTYGMHFCLNVACAREGDPQAVLLRALEPTEGLGAMEVFRRRGRRAGVRLDATDLCSGPGKLCQALAIDRALDGVDLPGGNALWIEKGRANRYPPSALGNTPRIGIDCAGGWMSRRLRWFVAGCIHVSGQGNPRRGRGRTSGS
jgi:DNA-3-methyladenine glycosylase